MKTIREIINTHSIEKNEDILQDMVDELYTYVEYRENLKVIEELEKLLADESTEWVDDVQGYEGGVEIVYSRDLRRRIKGLKQ